MSINETIVKSYHVILLFNVTVSTKSTSQSCAFCIVKKLQGLSRGTPLDIFFLLVALVALLYSWADGHEVDIARSEYKSYNNRNV